MGVTRMRATFEIPLKAREIAALNSKPLKQERAAPMPKAPDAKASVLACAENLAHAGCLIIYHGNPAANECVGFDAVGPGEGVLVSVWVK